MGYISYLFQQGLLGYNDTIDRTLPTINPFVSNALQASMGSDHALVLRTDGKLYSWGLGSV
jgi:alpha-tubulin suppressor-like RCC1 family protein